jgi:hypothetical protein
MEKVKTIKPKAEKEPRGETHVGTGPYSAAFVQVPTKQMEEMMKAITELRGDRDMLLSIADKKQLSNYYQRNRGKIPTQVKLRTYNGKVVLGWRMTKDVVESDPSMPNRWIEDQRVELLYEDGTSSGEIYMTQFTRHYKQVDAEVRSRIVDEVNGNMALKVVRLDNGKEYMIGITYVN